MLKPIFVVPAPGAIVRDPDRLYQPIPETGAFVNPGPYWTRQIRSGAVTIRKGPKPAQAPAPETVPAAPKKTTAKKG